MWLLAKWLSARKLVTHEYRLPSYEDIVKHRKLPLTILIFVTLGSAVAVVSFYAQTVVVQVTTTTASKTAQTSGAERQSKKPEISPEGTSRAISPASSELTHPTKLPTTARTAGAGIVNVQNHTMSRIGEQMTPVVKVPPETVPNVTSPNESIRDKAWLRDKIEQPVDLEDMPEPEIPLWRVNAVMLPDIPAGPQVAVVIDDAGIDRRRTREVIGLPAPLTIAFLTYARRLDEQVKLAVSAGHEILTHVPMQPVNVDANPGKNALSTDLKPAELKSRLVWALNRIPAHVGINNHMGSRYTSHEKGMQLVMAELRKRGLLFLDSRTSRNTVGAKLAKIYRVPHAVRNIFLDHDPNLESIRKQLAQLERISQKKGYAVAIGHPREATIEALSQWLPILAEKGVVLVPISAIIARREGIPQSLVKLSRE